MTFSENVAEGIQATYATTRVAIDWSRFAARTGFDVVEIQAWTERGGDRLGRCTAYVDWCDIRPLPDLDFVDVEISFSEPGNEATSSIWLRLENTGLADELRLPTSLDEVEDLRGELRSRILGPGDLEAEVRTTRIADLCPDVTPEYCDAFGAQADLTGIMVTMEYGLTSLIAVLHPGDPSGETVVWHRGHEPELATVPSFVAAVEGLLDRGVTVYVVSMVLFPPNPTHLLVEFPGRGTGVIAHHDELFLLESGAASPLRFFLQPALVAIREARDAAGGVSLVGISGGGWTVVLAAALDGAIGRTISIAGSTPMMEMLGTTSYLPDLEQRLPGLFPDFDYPTLYALASLPDRHLELVYNTEDPCCFAQDSEPSWFSAVRASVAVLGGSIALVLEDSTEHDVPTDLW